VPADELPHRSPRLGLGRLVGTVALVAAACMPAGFYQPVSATPTGSSPAPWHWVHD
jgi:hypothetical protein